MQLAKQVMAINYLLHVYMYILYTVIISLLPVLFYHWSSSTVRIINGDASQCMVTNLAETAYPMAQICYE